MPNFEHRGKNKDESKSLKTKTRECSPREIESVSSFSKVRRFGPNELLAHDKKAKTTTFAKKGFESEFVCKKNSTGKHKTEELDSLSRKTLLFPVKTKEKDKRANSQPIFHLKNPKENREFSKKAKFLEFCAKIKKEIQTDIPFLSEKNIEDFKVKAIYEQMFKETEEFESSRQKYLQMIIENERRIGKLKRRINRLELKELLKIEKKTSETRRREFSELAGKNEKLIAEIKMMIKID